MLKFLQVLTITFSVLGTFMLAFGLKVRESLSGALKKELKLDEKGLIAPSEVTQRSNLIYGGLFVITISAILQILLITHPPTSVCDAIHPGATVQQMQLIIGEQPRRYEQYGQTWVEFKRPNANPINVQINPKTEKGVMLWCGGEDLPRWTSGE